MGSSTDDASAETFAGAPADLSHAGAVVDKAIEFMTGQNIGPLAIASALLGGALGMLSRSLDDAAVIKVLENAIAGVREGALRREGPDAPAAADPPAPSAG